jgi:hypothetical protein
LNRPGFYAALHGKGAVHRGQVGRAHAYVPVLDNAGLAANRMRALLDRGGDICPETPSGPTLGQNAHVRRLYEK